MKIFELRREVDETGISGTGTVAQGVIFDDGRCALRWLTACRSTAIYDSIEDVVRIHGHGGLTKVVVVFDLPSLEERHRHAILAFQDDIENALVSVCSTPNGRALADHRDELVTLFKEREMDL